MPRSIDDDFPRRIANAEAALDPLAAGGTEAEPEPERTVLYLTVAARNMERAVRKVRFIGRVRRVCVVVGMVAFVAGIASTLLGSSLLLRPAIGCGLVVVLSAAVWIGVRDRRIYLGVDSYTEFKPLPELEALAESLRTELTMARAQQYPDLNERRSRYREDIHGIIQQYQGESRRYRRIHNTLQTLIMVGSAVVTTVSSLDTEPLTWQRITTIAVSFAITVSAAITGYYKYRERAYFLQQTADAIEEQLNGYEYGVGDYKDEDPDNALARLTKNVEDLRNEQRRRQQQLDQPTEQAPPTAAPSA